MAPLCHYNDVSGCRGSWTTIWHWRQRTLQRHQCCQWSPRLCVSLRRSPWTPHKSLANQAPFLKSLFVQQIGKCACEFVLMHVKQQCHPFSRFVQAACSSADVAVWYCRNQKCDSCIAWLCCVCQQLCMCQEEEEEDHEMCYNAWRNVTARTKLVYKSVFGVICISASDANSWQITSEIIIWQSEHCPVAAYDTTLIACLISAYCLCIMWGLIHSLQGATNIVSTWSLFICVNKTAQGTTTCLPTLFSHCSSSQKACTIASNSAAKIACLL